MKAFNLSAWAVREQAITLFLIVALALSGAYAFFALGRAEEPSFTVKTLTATVLWPGATAEEVQDLVADPLEKRLQELTWYDRVETMARPGMAVMNAHPQGQYTSICRAGGVLSGEEETGGTARMCFHEVLLAPSSTTNIPTWSSRFIPLKAGMFRSSW